VKWKRNLQSVGIKIFITYFDYFHSNLSTDKIIEKLPQKYSENAKRTRINAAKRIINNNLKEVLEYIINDSKKIDNEIKKKAENILKNNFKI